MLKGIISITGKAGLYKLLSRGKNNLIVENITAGKRMPTYPHEKVISLPDISIYTEGGDVPLPDVLEKLYAKADGKAVDMKGFATPEALREYFAEVLPEFDRDRVYTTDIRKLFSWYNLLVAAGFTEFKDEEPAEDQATDNAAGAESEKE